MPQLKKACKVEVMFDLTSLGEFSRNNCIAICAFLIPANLLATSQTLLQLFQRRSPASIRLASLVASLFAITLFLHVGTWLMIGVVAIPTYVLFGLGLTCLAINLTTMVEPSLSIPLYRFKLR